MGKSQDESTLTWLRLFKSSLSISSFIWSWALSRSAHPYTFKDFKSLTRLATGYARDIFISAYNYNKDSKITHLIMWIRNIPKRIFYRVVVTLATFRSHKYKKSYICYKMGRNLFLKYSMPCICKYTYKMHSLGCQMCVWI